MFVDMAVLSPPYGGLRIKSEAFTTGPFGSTNWQYELQGVLTYGEMVVRPKP